MQNSWTLCISFHCIVICNLTFVRACPLGPVFPTRQEIPYSFLQFAKDVLNFKMVWKSVQPSAQIFT